MLSPAEPAKILPLLGPHKIAQWVFRDMMVACRQRIPLPNFQIAKIET